MPSQPKQDRLPVEELAQKIPLSQEVAPMFRDEVLQRLAHLEQFVPALGTTPSYLEVADAIEKVKAITREVFSSDFEITEEQDWTAAGHRYFQVSLIDRGSLEEILARDHEWHRRITELPPDVMGLFCLSIDPQD